MNEKNEILQRVKDVIIKQKGIKKVKEIDFDTSLRKDLAFDSLALVELALACEDEFDIEIPGGDEEFNKIDTVRQAINYFMRRLNG